MNCNIKKPTNNTNNGIRAVFLGESRHCLEVAATMAYHLRGKMLLHFAPEWLGIYLTSSDRTAVFQCHVPAVAFKDYAVSETKDMYIHGEELRAFLDGEGGIDDELILGEKENALSLQSSRPGAQQQELGVFHRSS
nr:hypothetical protein [Candidatus Sigynarchaeota archaeon]